MVHAVNLATNRGRPVDSADRVEDIFIFYPDQPSFTSRMLWIENNDSEPWRIGAYYHYLISNIAGNAADDEPGTARWTDLKAGIQLGVAAFTSDYQINFWKDDTGREHPDTWRKLDRILQPGERFAETLPPVYIVAGTQTGDGNWEQLVSAIRQSHQLIWQQFGIEKQN
jgi:hypothetical protein